MDGSESPATPKHERMRPCAFYAGCQVGGIAILGVLPMRNAHHGLGASIGDLCSARDQVNSEHSYVPVFPQHVYHLAAVTWTGDRFEDRSSGKRSKKSGRAVGVADRDSRPGVESLMDAVTQLCPTVGIESACDALGVARASFYRMRPTLGPLPTAVASLVVRRPAPARALNDEERLAVRAVLNSTRFQDCAPAAIQATLLDEGQYLCSTRTMYRVLEQDGATRKRRDQLTHPAYRKPELLATAPNQLWSWDITKLRGPAKWAYFYLYVILDVFSRYVVVGWWRCAKAPD